MIERIAEFLQHNLIVLVAVVLVPLKLVILRLCGDGEGQKVALASIPEDLVYVSLGLVLGDFATRGGAFHRRFSGSSNIPMDFFVVILIGFCVAVVVHLLAQVTNKQFKYWRAATSVRVRPKAQGVANKPPDANLRGLQIRHLAGGCTAYLLQLVAAVWWLQWIARVLSNG